MNWVFFFFFLACLFVFLLETPKLAETWLVNTTPTGNIPQTETRKLTMLKIQSPSTEASLINLKKEIWVCFFLKYSISDYMYVCIFTKVQIDIPAAGNRDKTLLHHINMRIKRHSLCSPVCVSNSSHGGIWQPLYVPAMFLLHGRDSKRPLDWPGCLFMLSPALLDRSDGVQRGEATACFFCSTVTTGVTFPSQALSAKSQYLPAR